MERYAWVITKDYLSEGEHNNLTGPRDATPDEVQKARTEGARFRMYDDDGDVCYAGRCWVANDDNIPAAHPRYPNSIGSLSDEHFGPLNDWGTPGAGCTEIRYLPAGSGKYLTL